MATFGCEFFLSYGMTECCGKISMSLIDSAEAGARTPAERFRLVSTSGRPFRDLDLRVVDADGLDVAPAGAGAGEVLCRGTSVLDRYGADRSGLGFAGGWFRTGDLAAVADAALGYIAVVDRRKDVIVVGGENVYCSEVELSLIHI